MLTNDEVAVLKKEALKREAGKDKHKVTIVYIGGGAEEIDFDYPEDLINFVYAFPMYPWVHLIGSMFNSAAVASITWND